MSAPTGMFIELQIETDPEVAEILAAELAEMVGGVEIRDTQTIFPTAQDRAAVVVVFPPEQREEILAHIDETLVTARAGGAAVDPVGMRERRAHEDEWRDVWKQFFRATRIGKRFVVRPSWDQGPVPEAIFVLDMDPGRAFGTGAHPSTRLVIAGVERLADQNITPATLLDLGCGSGILTIAARRLWPKVAALAVDIDAESVACSLENFERNGLRDIATAAGGLEVVKGTFDVILANIQADVLQRLAPDLVPHLAPGGFLLLSGILVEQGDAVAAAFTAQGLQCIHREIDGEWTSLHFSSSN